MLQVSRDESKSKKPLMYIHQPDFKVPDQHMQRNFVGGSLEERRESAPEQTGQHKGHESVNKRAAGRKKTSFQEQDKFEEVENPVKVKESFSAKESVHAGPRVMKPFTEMTVREKLDYLAVNPPYYTCTFETESEKIAGKMAGRQGADAVIRKTDGSLHTLKSEEIIHVRINQ